MTTTTNRGRRAAAYHLDRATEEALNATSEAERGHDDRAWAAERRLQAHLAETPDDDLLTLRHRDGRGATDADRYLARMASREVANRIRAGKWTLGE